MRAALSLLFAFSALSYAQSVISAHSGVVQYVEGDVSIDNQPIHPKFAQFPEVKQDQVISTSEGRVELLLTPGVFLRLAENSSVRMLANSLADTRIEVISGSALVEIAELLPNNAITFQAGGAQIALPHKGLYRVDASPARLRVYDGQARVSAETAQSTPRKGHEIALDSPTLAMSNFDAKDGDAFYRWGARRAEYVASANVTSARVANNSSYGSGYGYSSGFGPGAGNFGAWSWNPWFGMFTYIPANGTYFSPFGYAFYSPVVASALYIPRTGTIGAGMPRSVAYSPAAISRIGAQSAPTAFGSGRGITGGSPASASRSLGGGRALGGSARGR